MLVLLDIKMPGMDGHGDAAKIRALDESCPSSMISGHGTTPTPSGHAVGRRRLHRKAA